MSLNVLDEGAGPPILLLHGFTGSARTWEAQVAAWRTRHRCIAPDLLGHGGSEAPADLDAYRLERQAERLARLLVLLDAAPATVVGYSLGARLALVLALEHPRTVERLVLESPSAGIADSAARAERRAADERLADEIETRGVEAFVERWEKLPLFASQSRLPADARDRQRAERLRHTPHGLARSLRGAGQGVMTPLGDRLGEVSVPTLVVAGALDPVGLDRAETVAAAVPHARLKVVEDVGHAPHLEAPSQFERLVADFLSASPTSA